MGPDGRIYFVTAGRMASAKFGCFDPAAQRFELLADLGALEPESEKKTARVTASVVFDGRGTVWLATTAFPDSSGGKSGRLLPFSLKDRAFGEAITLEGSSIFDFGLDAKRGQLLVLSAQGLKGRFLRYDLKRKAWKEYGATLVAGLCRMVMLPDGGAVLVSGNDIYRYNPKKDALAKSGALPAPPRGHAGFFGASALILGPDGKTVYGITCADDLLFSINGKGNVKNLGPAFGPPAAHEPRMALAAADGKLYYAGFEKRQGQVGVYDLKAGKASVSAMATPERTLPGMACGSACVGRDKRIYLAGFGWTGCGLFAFPPLPEPTPWSAAERTYECRRVATGAITLDGELNDPGWQGIAPLEGFVTAGADPAPATAATTGYVAWSDTHLYFAFDCATGSFKTAGKERDDGIWDGECAELFVCPRGANAPYYEIDANPDGMIYDSRVQNYTYPEMEKHYLTWAKSWDGLEAKTKVKRDADGAVISWTLEAAVPFTAFDGGAPKVGDIWLFNAFRIAMPAVGEGEWSAWHSTGADFHRPHQFPKLKFVP